MPLMAFNLTTFTEAIKDHVRGKVMATFGKEAIDEDGDIEFDEVKESISAAFLEAEPAALTDNNSPTVAEYGAWVTVTVLPVALAVRVTRDSALRAWADPAAPAQMV